LRLHHMCMRWFVLLVLLSISPAWAQRPDARPDSHKAELDTLITALKQAPTEQDAGLLEARIRQMWLQAGSPAATLLMARGTRDLGNNADSEALDDFDAVLALEPNLAEAFHRRALARFALGDYRGALADIEQTLRREPRQFSAFQSLSQIAEAQGDFKGARAAWLKVMEISPKTPGGEERLKLLTRKMEGEAT
jgi:tetratricopeptide (TPR) repeat protein